MDNNTQKLSKDKKRKSNILFSNVLRKCREDLGLTQKQVADALNMDRSTYAYYETGNTQPTGSLIVKLSKIFNVDYSVFMEAMVNADEGANASREELPMIADSYITDKDKMTTLSDREQSVLLSYRVLSYKNKEKLEKSIMDMLEEQHNQA